MVILLCAAAKSDMVNNAKNAAASLPNIVFMVFLRELSVGRRIKQRIALEKATLAPLVKGFSAT
jgi:hypothetical protein